jgi:PadR family transcriptional regulator, regulatory protein PadR
VPRNRAPSAQTVQVLRALVAEPARWRYGYELGRETGLKAGSLYPILVRLADRGFLEASWEVAAPAGRPARHLYRLTADGRELAAASDPAATAVASSTVRSSSRRPIAQPDGA